MAFAQQFLKYGGVAAGSAVTDYAVFTLLLFLGAGVLPAQMVARIAGGIFSFIANRYWSFVANGSGSLKIESHRFLILYGFSYLMALAVLFLLTEEVGLAVYPAKIIADILSFLVNFLVMRHYVFSGKGGLWAGVRHLLGRGEAS